MIIIIQAGGFGMRFKDAGYTKPKPLVNIIGKPMLFWLLKNLDLTNIKFVIIPYNKELEKYRFEDLLKNKFPNINFLFHKLEDDTNGPAEATMVALNKLNIEDCPILSFDCDNFYFENVIKKWEGKNALFIFEDTDVTNNIYSYVTIVENKIVNIKEKEKISNYACSGGYGFNSWRQLLQYSKYIVDNNITYKDQYYMSLVIKNMCDNGIYFDPLVVDKDKYVCVGTPLHVRIFVDNIQTYLHQYPNMIDSCRICFDLDNTLITFPTINGDYSTCKPIIKNIDLLCKLKNLGHTIIIYTARGMKTCKNNLSMVIQNNSKIIFETLDKYNIPFDEIYFGKPYADFYVDDSAICAFDDLEKLLGIYNEKINPRDFNQLISKNLKIFRKISKNDSSNLSGEIYYYKNIPNEIKDLFTIMIDHDPNNMWYEMCRIDGISIHKIFLAGQLDGNGLINIMNMIDRIHKSTSYSDKNINIYDNYINKIKMRYNTFDYSKFGNNWYYNTLIDKLSKYEAENKGINCVIHGDPVFPNIIIDQVGKIKFIDMRGKMGNTLTIYGDGLYDWAKMYQSLIGYDEIIDEVNLDNIYKKELIQVFETKFIKDIGESLDDLKLITSSLLFTLIPLHNDEKCKKYYNLGIKLLKQLSG